MIYHETEKKIKETWQNLNPAYKNAFWLSFALINLAFLFHTINFMFGDHDWLYIRQANYWSEGSFEGRPLHFVLQSLLFGGHVLPVLNNLFSFAALSVSGILLAKYWRVPLSTLNYTLFATLIAVLPYTMVWLFYAKDTLINLSLPLITVAGLLFSEKGASENKIIYHILAVILFYFAFASYAAVINLLGVCFIGKLAFEYARKQTKFPALIKQNLLPVADMIIALILFKLTLMFMTVSTEYNTQTVPFSYLPEKLSETIRASLEQFIVPLPFMEVKYKLLLLVLVVIGFGLMLIHAGAKKTGLLVFLFAVMLLASKLAFFIADERGQVLAEMENFAFVPRLDFYGLVYIYAFGLACVLSFASGAVRKAGITLICLLVFMSAVRDMYAQKVWKFGFDAEMKAHERIVNRMEQLKGFIPGRKYRLLQIGSLSLRRNYYRKVANEQISLDLLETSFTPQYMSRLVYNFYYPTELFTANAGVNDLSSVGKTALNSAEPWPAASSVFIDGDIIVLILNEDGLDKARRSIR